MRTFIFDTTLLFGIGFLLIGDHPAVIECVNRLIADWQAHMDANPVRVPCGARTEDLTLREWLFQFALGFGAVAAMALLYGAMHLFEKFMQRRGSHAPSP